MEWSSFSGLIVVLAVATLIGLKPKTTRGVLKWCAIIAGLLAAASAVSEATQPPYGFSVLRVAIMFILSGAMLALFSLAIRAVVDRIARGRQLPER